LAEVRTLFIDKRIYFSYLYRFFIELDDQNDEKLLVPTVSNLIATLPGAHFATLNAIIKNITE
jgi:hypothetical protein